MQTITQSLTTHQLFAATLGQVAACATDKYPTEEKRIDSAIMIVLADKVQRHTSCTSAWRVESANHPDTEYDVCENTCTCPDYKRHATDSNAYACKHVWATWLYRRVEQRLLAQPTDVAPAPIVTDACWQAIDVDQTPCHMTGAACPHEEENTAGALLAPYIIQIHGKPFVQYAGLLALAHSRGLAKLESRFVSVTETMAVAEATATFNDGRIFTEASEATPENVGAQVRLHFARIALTRAKARCLRDALNIGICSIEELD